MNIPRFIDQSFSLDISTACEGVNLYEAVQHVKVWPLKIRTSMTFRSRRYNNIKVFYKFVNDGQLERRVCLRYSCSLFWPFQVSNRGKWPRLTSKSQLECCRPNHHQVQLCDRPVEATNVGGVPFPGCECSTTLGKNHHIQSIRFLHGPLQEPGAWGFYIPRHFHRATGNSG